MGVGVPVQRWQYGNISSMRIACWVPKATNTHTVFVILISTATVVTQRRLKADSHIPCRAPAILFRLCLSHLIYNVRPCLIHI
jgi:hypothetical protein